MKKIIISISLVIAAMLCSTSCSDYLDIVPEGTPSMDNAFSNRINSFKFLHTCYSYLPSWDQGGSIGFLAGDEHWLMPKGTGFIDQRISLNAWEIGRGEQNNNDPYQNFWDGGNGGTNLWVAIRDCNIFLENINKPLDLQNYERTRWIAEVKFLKAYYHYYLFMLYGPIPIMDTNIAVDASQDEVRRYREPVDDVVAYISNLLDEAYKDLPSKITDPGQEMGRITQPIAKAVKAQLLLLAASPLFNGNSDYINVKDNQGRHLFPTQVDNSKWKLAADAALEAINCAKENGHEKLYTFSLPINSISAATRKLLDIGEAVTEKWNEEIIWGSTRNVNGLQTVAMAKHTKGSHYNARSVLGPTLSVAEAFYSSNGVPISEDNSDFWTANYPNRYEITTIPDEGNNKYYLQIGEQTAYLHLNREPRFYASVSFNGCVWPLLKNAETVDYKNDVEKQVNYYYGINTDGFSGTGVYLRSGIGIMKYVHPDDTNRKEIKAKAEPAIRFAEILLIYAEALNELEDGSSYDIASWDGSTSYSVKRDIDEMKKGIRQIRRRAGVPDYTMSEYQDRDVFRKKLKRERQIELMAEGQRYFDLRRWKDAEVEESKKNYGCNFYMSDTEEQREQFYTPIEIADLPTAFSRKLYFWPISHDELKRNKRLTQNPGWTYND